MSWLFFFVFARIFALLCISKGHEESAFRDSSMPADHSTHAKSILLFGDSIDRQTVVEWCEMQKKLGVLVLEEREWGGTSIQYFAGIQQRKGRMSTLYCRTQHHSLAFVHMFGSSDNGPYLNFMAETPEDPYVQTRKRMDRSAAMYLNDFGPPSRIMINFGNWDVGYIKQIGYPKSNVTRLRQLADTYRHNLEIRTQQLKQIFPNSTDIGLRTAVWSASGEELLKEFNRVTRELAADTNCTLYDFDRDVWAGALREYDSSIESLYLRDWIHPRQSFTAVAGDKMLGVQHSNFFTSSRGRENSLVAKMEKIFYLVHPRGTEIDISAVNGSENNEDVVIPNLFYYSPRHHTLSSNVTLRIMRLMKLNLQSDLLMVDESWLSTVPMTGELPSTNLARCKVLSVAFTEKAKPRLEIAKDDPRDVATGANLKAKGYPGHAQHYRHAHKTLSSVLSNYSIVPYIAQHYLSLMRIESEAVGIALVDFLDDSDYCRNTTEVHITGAQLDLFPYQAWWEIPNFPVVNSKFAHGHLNGMMVQWPGDRSVYQLKNCKRHRFNSAQELFATGKTFDDVVAISQLELELFPLSERAVRKLAREPYSAHTRRLEEERAGDKMKILMLSRH